MTLVQANATIDRADSLFQRAARAWERGNNSGNSDAYTRGIAQCGRLRDSADALLNPLGIKVDYLGLYPSFNVGPYCYHTTESAVSAALEGGK